MIRLQFHILFFLFFLNFHNVFADVSHNDNIQRQGNFEIHFSTTPLNPIVGNLTTFEIIFHEIEQGQNMNIPAKLKLLYDMDVISQNDVILPAGMSKYTYLLNESGKYVFDIAIYDETYSKSFIDFYFPVTVESKSQAINYLYLSIFGAILAILIAALVLRFLKKKRIWWSFQQKH